MSQPQPQQPINEGAIVAGLVEAFAEVVQSLEAIEQFLTLAAAGHIDRTLAADLLVGVKQQRTALEAFAPSLEEWCACVVVRQREESK